MAVVVTIIPDIEHILIQISLLFCLIFIQHIFRALFLLQQKFIIFLGPLIFDKIILYVLFSLFLTDLFKWNGLINTIQAYIFLAIFNYGSISTFWVLSSQTWGYVKNLRKKGYQYDPEKYE